MKRLARQANEVTDDQPDEGLPGQGGRLTAVRHQAEEIIRPEYGPLIPDKNHNDKGDQPSLAEVWNVTTRRGRSRRSRRIGLSQRDLPQTICPGEVLLAKRGQGTQAIRRIGVPIVPAVNGSAAFRL